MPVCRPRATLWSTGVQRGHLKVCKVLRMWLRGRQGASQMQCVSDLFAGPGFKGKWGSEDRPHKPCTSLPEREKWSEMQIQGKCVFLPFYLLLEFLHKGMGGTRIEIIF